MKKKIQLSICLIIFLIVSAVIILIVKHSSIKFDNETPKNELITQVYNENMISNIIKIIDAKTAKVKLNQLDIKSQCIRKTDYGGYSIYNLESDNELYIFFNTKKEIITYTTVNKFVSSEEIMQYKNGTANDVLNLGSGVSIATSGNAKELRIYFLSDNKVGYVRFNELVLDGNEKIEEIIIKTNEEYLEAYKVLNWQPYILPIDRETCTN